MLKVDKIEKQGQIYFDLAGELDMHTGEILDGLLEKQDMTGIKRLVFSLSKLDFIDSTGIGQLIKYYREYAGQDIEIVVDNENEDIEEVLELIGLREIMQGS